MNFVAFCAHPFSQMVRFTVPVFREGGLWVPPVLYVHHPIDQSRLCHEYIAAQRYTIRSDTFAFDIL